MSATEPGTQAEGAALAAAPPPRRRRPVVPGSPASLAWRWWDVHVGARGLVELLGWLVCALAIGLVGLLWARLARVATDPWDASRETGALAVGAAAVVLVAADLALYRLLRGALPGARPAPIRRPATLAIGIVAATVVAAAAIVRTAPVWHSVAILFWQYPLVTWMPLLAGLVPPAVCAIVGRHRPADEAAALVRTAVSWQAPVVVLVWALAMVALPSLQGRALYRATAYAEQVSLPARTEPRVLPKDAARTIGASVHMGNPHLVVDPASGALVFSGEHGAGQAPGERSGGVALEPLDRIDAAPEIRAGSFHPALSATGPGSLTWRAYRRHFLTRVMERVIVPLRGGGAVAVAPYVGFKGFPVRHEFWQGVYVLHQDGRLEDLTPRQAIARPEIAASGHLFPEKLARDIAEAYGYRGGPLATLWARRTVVSDPKSDDTNPVGNQQPYLTNLGDGRVRWVTVAHPGGDESRVAAVFLTDSTTGRTEVWHPPPGRRVLSNAGAVRVARGAPLQWTDCCKDLDVDFPILRPGEPRPVFARGRFYYLVSAMPVNGYQPPQPVAATIVVDAVTGRIAKVVRGTDQSSAGVLGRFLGVPPRPG